MSRHSIAPTRTARRGSYLATSNPPQERNHAHHQPQAIARGSPGHGGTARGGGVPASAQIGPSMIGLTTPPGGAQVASSQVFEFNTFGGNELAAKGFKLDADELPGHELEGGLQRGCRRGLQASRRTRRSPERGDSIEGVLVVDRVAAGVERGVARIAASALRATLAAWMRPRFAGAWGASRFRPEIPTDRYRHGLGHGAAMIATRPSSPSLTEAPAFRRRSGTASRSGLDPRSRGPIRRRTRQGRCRTRRHGRHAPRWPARRSSGRSRP